MTSHTPDLAVLIGQAAVDEMLAHANQGFPLEIGGHLLGYKLTDPQHRRIVTYIDRAMRAETDSTHTHVRFLPTNVVQVQETCERERLQIVGYYHSHPGFGVFQSGEDVRNFSLYYTEEHHIAVVVDPTKAGDGQTVKSEWLGFFAWDSRMKPFLLGDQRVRVVASPAADRGDVVETEGVAANDSTELSEPGQEPELLVRLNPERRLVELRKRLNARRRLAEFGQRARTTWPLK